MFMDGRAKVEDTYLKHRVGFMYPISTYNISIVINNTQERDSGQYMCSVSLVDDSSQNGGNIGFVNLTVLGKFEPLFAGFLFEIS